MPLDFSIPSRALANLPNPAANYAQALSLKDMMQQAQLRDTQLADATEQRQQRMTLRELTAKAIRPDGTIDGNALRAAYAQTGDIQGLTAYNASEAQAAEAQRKARAAEIETNMKQVGYIAQLVGNVRDPETWALALQQAKATGLDTSQFEGIPYSPQLVEQIKGAALTTAQQLEQEWKAKDYGLKAAEFGYRQQNDAANRAVTLRGQNMVDARAREATAGTSAPGMPKINEGQAKATGLYRQASAAAQALNSLKDWSPNLVSQALSGDPKGVTTLSQADRRAYNAFRTLASASLRLESGAAISEQEIANKALQITPLPGDGPEVLADKAAQRNAILLALRDAGGPGTARLPRVQRPQPASRSTPADIDAILKKYGGK